MPRPPHYLVIVRAGETAIFEALKLQLAHEPYPSTLVWDRRVPDRVGRPDPRRSERRAPPDSFWQTHGFLVVEVDGAQLDFVDAYRNPAAEAQRQLDFYQVPRRVGPGAPPFRDRRERPFGLEMFKSRLRATLQEPQARPSQARHGHSDR